METNIIFQDQKIKKNVPSVGKVMLMLFWHFNGPILSTTRIMDRQSIHYG